MADGIDHGFWLLRGGSIVQIHQGSPVDLLVQDGELGSDVVDIVGHYRANSKLMPSLSAMTRFKRFSSCGIFTYSKASEAKA